MLLKSDFSEHKGVYRYTMAKRHAKYLSETLLCGTEWPSHLALSHDNCHIPSPVVMYRS